MRDNYLYIMQQELDVLIADIEKKLEEDHESASTMAKDAQSEATTA